MTRDGRKAIDNVDDEAERELKKVYRYRNSINKIKYILFFFQEVYVVDGIKRQLHQQVQSAFDQIARLNEAKQQLIRVNIFSIGDV